MLARLRMRDSKPEEAPKSWSSIAAPHAALVLSDDPRVGDHDSSILERCSAIFVKHSIIYYCFADKL